MSENTKYIEELFEAWESGSRSVDPAWNDYFAKLAKPGRRTKPVTKSKAAIGEKAYKQSRVDSLLWAYRDVGYRHATLNPLGEGRSPDHSYLDHEVEETYEQLTLEEFGLSPAELGTLFSAGRAMKPRTAPLREIINAFRETYCSSIGVEFLHIQNKHVRLLRRLSRPWRHPRRHPRLPQRQRLERRRPPADRRRAST